MKNEVCWACEAAATDWDCFSSVWSWVSLKSSMIKSEIKAILMIINSLFKIWASWFDFCFVSVSSSFSFWRMQDRWFRMKFFWDN